MKFSQKTEYALRALMELGLRADEGPVPTREVAKAQRIPGRFCEQVIGDLRKAGLVESQRGAGGGCKLARSADDITIGEVVHHIEGPLVTQAVLDPFDDEARRAAHSAIQELWLDLQICMRERLAAVSLADLIRRQAALDRSSYLVFQI